jgi:hypothetical protein
VVVWRERRHSTGVVSTTHTSSLHSVVSQAIARITWRSSSFVG